MDFIDISECCNDCSNKSWHLFVVSPTLPIGSLASRCQTDDGPNEVQGRLTSVARAKSQTNSTTPRGKQGPANSPSPGHAKPSLTFTGLRMPTRYQVPRSTYFSLTG